MHFSSTAQGTLDVTATSYVELGDLIDSLLEDSTDRARFRSLSLVTREEVIKTRKTLWSDSSTGPDQIPTKFVKLVAEYLAEPLTIVNGCIINAYFPKLWNIARVSSIPEVDNPITNDQFRPISTTSVI